MALVQQNTTERQATEKFHFLVERLHSQFPDLDLRFNRRSGSDCVRFMAAAVSKNIFELDLGRCSSTDLLHEAIFKIKEAAQIFDA